MLLLSDKEKAFIIKNIKNADTLLKQGSQRDILIAINDFINEKGFAPPDFYDYNELGREAQRIYDSIYQNN